MDTRKEALEAIQKRLPKLRNFIYDEIKKQSGSIYDISKRTGLSINIVSPRVRELVQMGKIICVGKKKNSDTGLTNKVWGVNKFGISVDKYDIEMLPRRELIKKIKELEKKIKIMEGNLL